MADIAAYLYAALTATLVVFHGGLALGAPWGHLTMGGRFPGRLTGATRLLPLISAALLIGFALVVWDRAGVIDLGLPPSLIWVVLGLMVISSAANGLTPSKPERRLWFPVTLIMVAAILVVALTVPPPGPVLPPA